MDAQINDLTRLLASPDSASRASASQQFCQMGEDAAPAAVALIHACADESDDVRDHASAALEELGPPLPTDVDALSRLLADPHADVVYWSATLLGRLEADAADAVPQLAQTLTQSPHLAARERCAWALGRIGASDPVALNALRLAASEAQPRLARLAKEALARIQ